MICSSCSGSRENNGVEGSPCYSCKGTGIRKDPLFHKEQKCNTCKGFGNLVKDACKTCHGRGLLAESLEKDIHITRFVKNQEELIFKHEGNQSIYKLQNGKHGDLKVKIIIVPNPFLTRKGNNVF